jgi:purine-binding chemotaxis protein CheW
MDIGNHSEEGIRRWDQTEPDRSPLPLNRLIAEIDREIGGPESPESPKEAGSRKPEGASDRLQHQFILFALESTLFALPISSALEIGHRPDITPLPNLPHWVMGISNIRGEIISFVNLKAFLGIPSTGKKGEDRFIIIHDKRLKTGIIVDSIRGIVVLNRIDHDIQNSPYRQGDIARYILGVAVSGGNLMNILDIDRLLCSEQMNSFRTC